MEIQGDGNTYTANLENRSNIIGIEATDADGNVKSLYRVVDARFIEINVENKTNPDAALEPGDTANISFRGVTMPVYKLATIIIRSGHRTVHGENPMQHIFLTAMRH